MVTKRIRTEYMKKFKDPKWESYSKCYEDMLKYRLTRRLLEHSHSPWFWNGSDSDSDVGGSPTPPNKKLIESVTAKDRQEVEYEQCEGVVADQHHKELLTRPESPEQVPKIPLPEDAENLCPSISAANEAQGAGTGEINPQAEVEREEQRTSSRCMKQPTPAQRQEQDRKPHPPRPERMTSSKSLKVAHHARVGPAPRHTPEEPNKENRHPFALYASGERHADMAAKKTHNVGPAASTMEIHESALRAKARREVERSIQIQRAERRRAKLVDLDKNRSRPTQPEFNPWLTEYMRCFSALTQ